jgi:RNA ligase
MTKKFPFFKLKNLKLKCKKIKKLRNEIINTISPDRINSPFDIFTKEDGSLIIVFKYNDEIIIASRGSFTSSQTIKAKEILKKYNTDIFNDNQNLSLIFEYKYPENRIVCDYKEKEELVLLGAIKTNTGEDLNYTDLVIISNNLGCPIVQKRNINIDRSNGLIKMFESIKNLDIENEEGFVIRFNDSYRIKVKFPNYVRLHSIMTNTSSYDIWESLMENGKISEELLEIIPDEFYDWVKKIEKKLIKDFSEFKNTVYAEYCTIILDLRKKELNTDKDFAFYVIKNPIKSFLFSLRNGKDIDKSIWKRIKTKFERPFASIG